MELGEDSLKKIWFDFDNLNFNTGSTVITDESQAQINNLVAILKAYPTAKLKIGDTLIKRVMRKPIKNYQAKGQML